MLNSLSFARWRAMLPGLSLLCVLAGASPVRAQSSNDPLNPHMTAHISNVSFRVALQTMCRTVDVSFRLPDNVAAQIDPNETYNVDVTDGTFQDGLNSLLEQVDPQLAFHLEDGSYVLEISKTPRAGKAIKKARAIRRDTYAVKNTPFEEAVRSLFYSEQTRYQISPAVTAYLDPVTFSVEDATLPQKLDALLKAAAASDPALTYRIESGVYVIASRYATARNSGNTPIGLPSYNPLPRIKAVSIHDERIGAALEQMFTQAGVSYAFVQPASVVASPRLTFAMRGVPLEQAVVHLLRSAPTEPMLRLGMFTDQGSGFKKADAAQAVYTVTPDEPLFGLGMPPDMRHWFSFRNLNLYSAFKAIVAGSKVNYSIDPAMRDIKVTVSGSDLSVEAAVSRLLAASPVPIQSSSTNGILNIQMPPKAANKGARF